MTRVSIREPGVPIQQQAGDYSQGPLDTQASSDSACNLTTSSAKEDEVVSRSLVSSGFRQASDGSAHRLHCDFYET